MNRFLEIENRRRQIKRSYDYKSAERERLEAEMTSLNEEDERLMNEYNRTTTTNPFPHSCQTNGLTGN